MRLHEVVHSSIDRWHAKPHRYNNDNIQRACVHRHSTLAAVFIVCTHCSGLLPRDRLRSVHVVLDTNRHLRLLMVRVVVVMMMMKRSAPLTARATHVARSYQVRRRSLDFCFILTRIRRRGGIKFYHDSSPISPASYVRICNFIPDSWMAPGLFNPVDGGSKMSRYLETMSTETK